ncbi:alpha/beta fold hydrolase [Mucilaginibacter paludis]|uniref:Alpha/beta hydrolase fold containing protein n=1 Tax=Mucilaginibacter paludis DSM 18603 TaxID=714943 RepID=H1YD61_9SPHI|nr:alpha/beta fold hydrolase [Mucilaginibacter paludis]EHQ26118.1 alpha/beta hydrolase fold containing protein [Mucilaginibacter paludis DSM 18603]
MKKLTTIIAILFLASAFASAQQKSNRSNIVIVHGSWSSAGDWGTVAAQLKTDGNDVTVVNLPGHGADETPINQINLQGYVDAVKKAIGSQKDVILVGHSFGGIVISEVAEQIPSQIKKLIYVAAYIPKNGQSLLDVANTDANSDVPKYLQIEKEKGIAGIAANGIASTFVPDAPQAVQAYVVAHFKAEPLAPLAAPVTLTAANFGSVNKVFVHTFNDKVNSYSLQQRMVKDAGITRFYGLPSSHTPFVSMPAVLSVIIENEAK